MIMKIINYNVQTKEIKIDNIETPIPTQEEIKKIGYHK